MLTPGARNASIANVSREGADDATIRLFVRAVPVRAFECWTRPDGILLSTVIIAPPTSGAHADLRAQNEILQPQSSASHLEETIVTDFTHVFTAFETRSEVEPVIVALLPKIAAWISTSFDLPAINDLPRVQFVSSARITALRYGFAQALPGQTSERPVPSSDKAAPSSDHLQPRKTGFFFRMTGAARRRPISRC